MACLPQRYLLTESARSFEGGELYAKRGWLYQSWMLLLIWPSQRFSFQLRTPAMISQTLVGLSINSFGKPSCQSPSLGESVGNQGNSLTSWRRETGKCERYVECVRVVVFIYGIW